MKFLIWIIISLYIPYAVGQVAINSDGSLPHQSAMLDIVSTEKGMLIPRLTSTQRNSISNPANGLLVFDETTYSFWFYDTNASAWKELSSDNSLVENINDLSDASTSSTSIHLGSNSGTNSSGDYNNSLGINSLQLNTSGASNIAIGYNALLNNTTGNYNIGIGTNALGFNQTGNNNIAIGHKAGESTSLHNISGSVFMGYMAGFNETNSNMLYIENSSSSTPLIGGNFTLDTLAFAGDLSVTGALKLAGLNPANGRILRSQDDEGNAIWSDAIDFNIGIDDLYDGKTGNNVSNTFLGKDCGAYLNVNCDYNTGAGYEALRYSGENSNTVFGANSLKKNYNHDDNVVIGSNSLNSLSNNNKNVIIGNSAGTSYARENNIFIGNGSYSNDEHSNMLCIGPATPLIEGNYEGDYGYETLRIYGDLTIKDTLSKSNVPTGYYLIQYIHNSLPPLRSHFIDPVYTAAHFSQLTDGSSENESVYLASIDQGDSLNVAIGVNAFQNNTSGGTCNVIAGTSAMAYSQQADSNVVIGSYAGYGNSTLHNSTGNIFLGYKAGYNELGDNKLYIENSDSNTPLIGGDFAEDSLAIAGDLSIYGNLKTSGGNPAIGKVLTSDALGNAYWGDGSNLNMSIDDLNDASSDNSSLFMGYRNGSVDDGTSNRNTALGAFSMNKNTSGHSNTAMGYYSLYSNIIGRENVAVGYYALRSNTNNSNTAIGYGASNSQTTYINTTAIGYNARALGSNRIIFGNTTTVNIGGYANWTHISDKRFKKNIQENIPGLEFIMGLNPISFHYDISKLNAFLEIEEKEADIDSKIQKENIQYTGFLAQEVDQLAKSLEYDFSGVHQPEHSKDHYSISYAEFVVPLVKAVQERQNQINQQKETIEQMQERLQLLQEILEEDK